MKGGGWRGWRSASMRASVCGGRAEGCGESEELEAVNRGLGATFYFLRRPSVNREAEELKENQLVFQCNSRIWVFKGQINIIPQH